MKSQTLILLALAAVVVWLLMQHQRAVPQAATAHRAAPGPAGGLAASAY